jgi:hypothetical protein
MGFNLVFKGLMCLHISSVLSLKATQLKKITFIIQEWSFSCCLHCIEFLLPLKCFVVPLNGFPFGLRPIRVNPHLVSLDVDCYKALLSKLLILFKHTSLDITSTLSDVTCKRGFEFILMQRLLPELCLHDLYVCFN